MSVLKKTLSSLALAGLSLVFTQAAFAAEQPVASKDNAEVKKMAKYAPKKGELAPANPELKIQSVNESFAEKYPNQYKSWKNTSNSTAVDSAIEQDPRMIVMWAGYAFAKDYNKPRGHFYSITDVRNILRTGGPMDANSGIQPMACWTCKGPDVARLIAEWGEEGYFNGKWAKGGAEVVNSIGCADCHDTTSKDFEEGKPALRIARPHVLRALDVIDKNFDNLARDDKRAAICANCHVEYYFDKNNVNNVVFPWFNGVDVDSIEKYYDDIEFMDWQHAVSKAPMLKTQHPDFEVWMQGTHGKNGVTCIDCHMPKVQGADGKVYTDHKIGNPFDAFEHTCAKCHDQSKETLQKIVADHKHDIKEVMIKLEDQLVKAHFEAKAAWEAGATKEEMAEALKAIRHAQWRWDYSAAGHGNHMHAPDIMLKVIATGLDRVADARTKLAIVLTKHGVQQPINYPDTSTAEKAWKAVGIDIEKDRKEKAEFLNKIVPQWDKEAKAKGLILNDAPPAK